MDKSKEEGKKVTAQKIVDNIIDLFETTYPAPDEKPELVLPYWIYRALIDELKDKLNPSGEFCDISIKKYRGFKLQESPKIVPGK